MMGACRKAGFVLSVLAFLIIITTSANADQCHRQLPANGVVPTEFCIDGNLPQAGHDRLIWTLSKKQAQHAWMWSLRGARSAVTRLEIYPAGKGSGKPVYTLLDRSSLSGEDPLVIPAGEIDTIMLRPGRYFLVVSCDGACTGKGDPYVLQVMAAPFESRLGYRHEEVPNNKARPAQSLPVLFGVDHANLEGSADTYAWTIQKQDAATCWQLFLLLPADEQGWVKLYDPDGRLFAQRRTGENPHRLFATGAGLAAFLDLGVRQGRYLIRVGPAKHYFTPYEIFTVVLGTRAMESGKRGSTLNCPVLDGE